MPESKARRKVKVKISDVVASSVHIVAGNKIVNEYPDPTNRTKLREWWYGILRTHGRYSSYAILLALPSDKEAIRYITQFGRELDLISGDNCLVIAISQVEIRRFGSDDELWATAIEEHISEGYSIKVGQTFGIEITEFPCLVLFQDIRSPDHVIVTLKGMNAEEISEKMRLVFSIMQKAITNNENPLDALEAHRNKQELHKVGQSIIGQFRNLGGKTFEMAIESLVKASIG